MLIVPPAFTLFLYLYIMYESKSIFTTKDKTAKDCCVYFLFLNKKIVYIGKTKNINSRLSMHTRDKMFDSYYIFKDNITSEEALYLEINLVHFVTLFGDGYWYNKENWELVFLRETKLKNEFGTVIELGLNK